MQWRYVKLPDIPLVWSDTGAGQCWTLFPSCLHFSVLPTPNLVNLMEICVIATFLFKGKLLLLIKASHIYTFTIVFQIHV